jgi:acetyl-CoA carboxylase carboxyl transferase subunit alpha
MAVPDSTELSVGSAVSPAERSNPDLTGANPRSDSLGSSSPEAGQAWQRVQLARHPERPYTLDYVRSIFDDFVELHGDRLFSDDAALVGGLAALEGTTVVVFGQQKGRDTRENAQRHFGMARPEGYRKALRLMQQAEKFGFPVISFIDTPGADPTLPSEERGQAFAIANNLLQMARLKTLSIALVIGEGGSGGAIAIGLADRVLMLENAVYSVASPEASASILWRDAALAPQAAETLRITAQDLLGFGLIDAIVPEPPGGAHTDALAAAQLVKAALLEQLASLESSYRDGSTIDAPRLLADRFERYRRMGVHHEGSDPPL